jgi:alpha-tubulin suppressor-like RCC1 family protein
MREVMQVLQPTCIQFEKFCNPVVSVACGSAHILVLTMAGEMYSWGDEKNGCLGHEDESYDAWKPRPHKVVVPDFMGHP